MLFICILLGCFPKEMFVLHSRIMDRNPQCFNFMISLQLTSQQRRWKSTHKLTHVLPSRNRPRPNSESAWNSPSITHKDRAKTTSNPSAQKPASSCRLHSDRAPWHLTFRKEVSWHTLTPAWPSVPVVTATGVWINQSHIPPAWLFWISWNCSRHSWSGRGETWRTYSSSSRRLLRTSKRSCRRNIWTKPMAVLTQVWEPSGLCFSVYCW